MFGITDYIDYTTQLTDVPAGARKILYLNVVNPVQTSRIQEAAAAAPGSIWYVLGEPNAHGKPVQDVIVGLHDTYEAIKQADPTALITSPSILNFAFNCINCSGYQTGADWIYSFRTTYMDFYGEPPPIDIWAIDVFPIVWPGGSLPASQAFPTVRDDIVIKQLQDYRLWLDIWDDSRGKPIWVTEFGLHWGFTDWKFGVAGCSGPSPVGEYQTAKVKDYLRRVYTWLEANSDANNIQRWFTFSSYRDISVCQSDSGNGLSFLDSSGTSGQTTDVGQFFYNWIRGIR